MSRVRRKAGRPKAEPSSNLIEVAATPLTVEAMVQMKREDDEQFVEDLISLGRTLSQILRLARQPPIEAGMPGAPGGRDLPAAVTREVIERVHDKWAAEAIVRKPREKEETVRRLLSARYMALAKGKLGDVVRFEDLLMRIQGTAAPEKHMHLHADIKGSVMRVVSALTEEELDELNAEDEETKRLIELGRAAEKH